MNIDYCRTSNLISGNVLSTLVDEGYGNFINEYSVSLGKGLWRIEIGQALLSIFENGFRYEADLDIEINYSSLSGIKSFMTIEQVSKSQREEINGLLMRFECGVDVYDLVLPVVIYSSLLGYFCDRVKQYQHGEVATGFAD